MVLLLYLTWFIDRVLQCRKPKFFVNKVLAINIIKGSAVKKHPHSRDFKISEAGWKFERYHNADMCRLCNTERIVYVPPTQPVIIYFKISPRIWATICKKTSFVDRHCIKLAHLLLLSLRKLITLRCLNIQLQSTRLYSILIKVTQ